MRNSEKKFKIYGKHQVRPGLTGWAQVNGYRGDTSIRKRIDCDLYYIENWSIGFDIKILFLTIFKGFINKMHIKKIRERRWQNQGQRHKKILFAVEIIVLLLLSEVCMFTDSSTPDWTSLKSPRQKTQPIEVNQEVQDSINAEESKLTGYTTYALFGIDHRDMSSTGGMNSDTMIIASVNNDTKDVSLHLYTDTLLNVYDDTYSKANAAYARSPEAAVNMLNRTWI